MSILAPVETAEETLVACVTIDGPSLQVPFTRSEALEFLALLQSETQWTDIMAIDAVRDRLHANLATLLDPEYYFLADAPMMHALEHEKTS